MVRPLGSPALEWLAPVSTAAVILGLCRSLAPLAPALDRDARDKPQHDAGDFVSASPHYLRMTTQGPGRHIHLETARLTLRPTEPADVDRAFEIQSDWAVTRMLRMAAFPPNPGELRSWFCEHPDEWLAGRAYRFAVESAGRMIGVCDVDEIIDGEGDLGYWLESAAWGKGVASEAAQAVVRFAFEQAGLRRLLSGHAADNPASGAVLRRLGFKATGEGTALYRSRGAPVMHICYAFERP